MRNPSGTGRRGFIKSAAAALTAASGPGVASPHSAAHASESTARTVPAGSSRQRIEYPRHYSGRQLEMLAFPLGGIGTGSISLGGRGQFRDWEIYNRPDKGRSPEYAFASLWVKAANAQPVAHVLESRLLPPYASTAGLGPANAPGLSRLEGATFTGEYPLAHIDFHDSRLPVLVSLEAFSPFIPLDPENSGFPVAVLRYRIRNTGQTNVTASIAFSLDNPVGPARGGSLRPSTTDARTNEFRGQPGGKLQGLYMSNSALAEADPERGTFALCVLDAGDGRVSYLRGWPAAKWWASPLLFWDDFTADGQLGPEASVRKRTASLCLQRDLKPGAEGIYTFLLAWHFPNRTPDWSGWTAPKGHEHTIIGNYYCTRYRDSWAAAEQLAEKLPELEKRTKAFVAAMRSSTLPGAVRDAAMSNLSTLVTQTSFRTADGEFHGFEGCSDHRGCCFGNCTHVWNYETSTQFLFPTLARSLRNSAFGFSQDDQGGMRFRQMLPDGIDRFGYAAADGQMGQIIKLYLDWKLFGDVEWLREYWPKVKKALSYAWIEGGWDPDRDGVMEGVQHNTYDVEFYGPNPLGTVYYLGALRAAEEMARRLGDAVAAEQYGALFQKGKLWVDANLFNGEYYIQKVRSIPKDQIARSTVGDMGADHPEKPEFQLGEGCLADQLIGQYLADIAGLGPLLDRENIRKTLQSIYKYNHRNNLFNHDSVQRIYALNDEPALLICDYGKRSRPSIPFPYYAEAWTGIEYLVAAQFIYHGMVNEGLEVIEDVRKRFDGERRNPWDEPECGHHYARAMSAWSSVIGLSGFEYHGSDKVLTLNPKLNGSRFASFWSSAAGWGQFSLSRRGTNRTLELQVVEGALPVAAVRLNAATGKPNSSVKFNEKPLDHKAERLGAFEVLSLSESISIPAGGKLVVTL